MSDTKPIVLVTGATSEVAGIVIAALTDAYEVVGMDRQAGKATIPVIAADFTQDASVARAVGDFVARHGARIASVLHLAAYFDFTGEDNPLYQSLNVEGTRRLLKALQPLRVEQFVYAGTMLVHAPVKPGEHLDESRPLDPQWAYPASKAAAEEVIRKEHGVIPYVLLHLAGLYTDERLPPTLAQQAARIFERDLESHVYPGDLRTGQSVVHGADLAAAFRQTVDRRTALEGATILIGDPDAVGYAALQDRLGELIHGEEWTTIRVPAALAAAGAWAQDTVVSHLPEALGGGKPFIRPFMAMQASDHYALDITRARELLAWSPRHRLFDELPKVVAALKRDPDGWYKANKIGRPPPDAA